MRDLMKAIGRAILSAIFLVLTGLMLAAAKYAPQLVFSFYPAWSRKALAALSAAPPTLPTATRPPICTLTSRRRTSTVRPVNES